MTTAILDKSAQSPRHNREVRPILAVTPESWPPLHEYLSAPAPAPRVLELEGDLDELEIENLKAVLDDYGAEPLLVLDLSRVTYLSSLAVSAIVTAMRRARTRGHELTVQVKRDTIPERVLFITAIPYRAI